MAEKGLSRTHYDPEHAIDLAAPRPGPRIGWWGVFPSRPCDCGGEDFYVMDWGMGYMCVECDKAFGTKEEWDWSTRRAD